MPNFKKHTPIRMCLVCRERAAQSTLLRLQCNEHRLVKHQGVGRSFYLCQDCIEHQKKKVVKRLCGMCHTSDCETVQSHLKEIALYGKS